MAEPPRSQPLASHVVQLQNRTAPSSMAMETDTVSSEPHVEQVVCRWPRVAFMSLLSAAERVPLHGPVGPFSLVRKG